MHYISSLKIKVTRHHYAVYDVHFQLYWYGVIHFTLILILQLFLIICKQHKHAASDTVVLLFDTCLCALRTTQFPTAPTIRVCKLKTPVLGSSWNVNHRITEGCH
jgi:hypothetical protein